jgi:hypothetical protein
MRAISCMGLGTLLLGMLLLSGCQDKYERLPAASEKELQSLKERYQALIDEAKTLKGGSPMKLLHHFSNATLTATQPADFKTKAGKFIADAAAGNLDGVKIRGARAPGKVRVLLVTVGGNKVNIPFVQTGDGWKFDDVDLAFGAAEKEPNLEGCSPASPPSILASVVSLQDAQASELDQVQAAIQLAEANDKATAEKFLGKVKKPWAKAALLYAVWKSGGACEPFAKAFPIDGEKQTEMYDSDYDSYRALLHGLFECAFISKSFDPTLRIYTGCYKVEGGARSEYVDPMVGNPQLEGEFLKVGLANQKPDMIVKAAIKTNYKYEQDPVANIVVGGLHGEKKTGFYQYIYRKARGGGKAGNLAKDWVGKMAKRDEMEPPGTEGGGQPQ